MQPFLHILNSVLETFLDRFGRRTMVGLNLHLHRPDSEYQKLHGLDVQVARAQQVTQAQAPVHYMMYVTTFQDSSFLHRLAITIPQTINVILSPLIFVLTFREIRQSYQLVIT